MTALINDHTDGRSTSSQSILTSKPSIVYFKLLLLFSSLFLLPNTGTAQTLLVPGTWPWTASCYPPGLNVDAMQLLFDPAPTPFCILNDAALRISKGVSWGTPWFVQLGVVDTNRTYLNPLGHWFSALAPVNTTVLRSAGGDLVLSATTSSPPEVANATHASMRFGTTITADSSAEKPHDRERMTLWFDGSLAVGTQGTPAWQIFGDSLHAGEHDMFHLHLPTVPNTYAVDGTAGYPLNQMDVMKLSYGGVHDPKLRYAEFGFDKNRQLSSFDYDEDLVLSNNLMNNDPLYIPGDIVVDNRRLGRAIRFGTTYDTAAFPLPAIDKERLTITANGNVGIDMIPDSVTGLMKPMDEVQIGGTSVPFPSASDPLPGLTIYGGSPLENKPLPLGGGSYPADWRYISFNHYVDHRDPSANRYHRFQPIGCSEISFSETAGGLIELTTSPFNPTLPYDTAMKTFGAGMTMDIVSETGMALYSDESTSGGIPYHHLFDILRPGVTPWPITRNTNGLCIHHTPVLITSDSTSTPSIDFANLGVRPNFGDGQTWYLAVNGPALFKEAFVNTNDWPDYVFLPKYNLRSIDEFDSYVHENHHLPELPSATEIGAAVPLGKMQSAMTKQVEELSLYIIELHKEVDALKAEVKEIKNKKGE